MTNRKPYSTDISDPQWAILKSLIPAPKTGGRPKTVDMREIMAWFKSRLQNKKALMA